MHDAVDASSPPYDGIYQYIVIGGGTSGCALAAALAKKGKTLVFERGRKEPDTTITSYCKERDLQTSRTEAGSWAISANVLGGASVINAGVFMKETQDGAFAKAHPFMDWQRVNKAYGEVGDKLAHERGSSSLFQTKLVEAMKEVGLGDKAIRTDSPHVGIYHPHTLFDGQGKRHTAADMLPTEEDPSFHNLTVKVNVMVTRILFDKVQGGPPKAIGVEYQRTDVKGAPVQQLIQRQAHFYLSGGALHSPKLLILSGIGDAEELKRHNIELVHYNPHVGLHLKDRPVVAVCVSSPLPIETALVDTMAFTDELYIGTVSGGFIASHMAKLTLAIIPRKKRSAKKRKVMKTLIELLPEAILKRVNQQFTFFLVLSHPTSEGEVSITSADPHADVSIFPPGINDPEEIKAVAKGLVYIRKLIDSASLAPYRRDRVNICPGMRRVRQLYSTLCGSISSQKLGKEKGPRSAAPVTMPTLPNLDPLMLVNDDPEKLQSNVGEEVQQWIKDMQTESWTYTGTCRFGDVVNHDFTVKGVDGLSIVDASVLVRPTRVSGQATMMMLGLYAGEMAPLPVPSC
jgi:choline dehydrogenase-like flavoprotein